MATHGHMTAQAMANQMRLDVKQIRTISNETQKRRNGDWMTEGQLETAGYTKSHIERIKQNCENEWDEEIEEPLNKSYEDNLKPQCLEGCAGVHSNMFA